MKPRRSEAVTLTKIAIISALYLLVAAYRLDLPGLHYDEAFEAVPAMQILRGQGVTCFRESCVRIAGVDFPLMTQDYIGSLNTLLAIPFMAAFGVNVVSLRAGSLLVGVLTLAGTYLLAREVYGSGMPAGVAALLLASMPSFVFWSRQGVFVTSITAAIGVFGALCWVRWWRGGGGWYALAGAFLCGLGLYAKFLFLWLIGAGAAGAVLLFWREWLDALRRRSLDGFSFRLDRKTAAGVLAAFALGALPLFIYNLKTGGTLKSIAGNAASSYYGTQNLAFLPNLGERVSQVLVVLSGEELWYLGGVFGSRLAPVLFVATAVAAVAAPCPGRRDRARRVLFPFVVVAVTVVESCVTVSALWPTHFAMLLPWLALCFGAAADFLPRLAGNRAARAAFGVAFAAVLALNARADLLYHRALAESGGLGTHSDAVYDLAEWLDARQGRPVVAMDWGLASPVEFLTAGRVRPVEAFGYDWETDADFAARIMPFLDSRETIYLWRAPDEVIFDRGGEFRDLYRPLGLEEDILEAFYERSGRPVLGATALVPEGTALNPP